MNILVADDHIYLNRFLKKGLEAKNFNVDTVEDGKIALQMCLDRDYDLVLLDIELPYLDGFKVCRKLRKIGKILPIIMLSNNDKLQDKLNGFESGADDYLASPFAFEELLARVKVCLSRKRQFNTNIVLEEADLYLDAETHEVVRGGISIYLTKKEFSLLQYLLQRKGKVLSRALIEEQIWGYQKDSMTNIVDVYIQKLRKKVDLNFGRLLIHTVRGLGYQLKATERRSPNRIPDQLYYQSTPVDFVKNLMQKTSTMHPK